MDVDSLWSVLTDIVLTPWGLGILGLCVGSFLNVVIHRMPKMMEQQWQAEARSVLGLSEDAQAGHVAQAEQGARTQGDAGALSLSKPASRCPSCGHAIRWYENIPVLSWLALRGKCSACGTRISLRYPFIELATAALFAACAWRFGNQPTTLLWCGFVAALVAASAIDWDTTILPDNITLPLLWAGLVVAGLGWNLPLDEALWGAVAGYLSLWSVYWLFKLTTGKEGMGYGDFKLLAALGAWLGWQMVLPIVLGSSIIGAVIGIGMKLSSQLREGVYVPYGPFLAGAGLVVALAGSARVLGWLGWA
ncbi:MAG: A24 family peptidase [Aquabacterium sp.]|jgi:leader peptidase (prepilin peptidase)/N-methyltransferase|uniref:prepilin peptidase n=1 Tax=Aquabacterium sp. TaxID=1872578 RepID=UPI002A35C5BC|nr:A24 family peptidase [Aquabacterium sp.]MDX9845244.1 A24 family peptidase [Aquabacterium sp.]